MNKFEFCENLMKSITKEFDVLEERYYTEEEKKVVDLLIIGNMNEVIKKVISLKVLD